jgi:uncharacterized protein YodC (DUF2158 family)
MNEVKKGQVWEDGALQQWRVEEVTATGREAVISNTLDEMSNPKRRKVEVDVERFALNKLVHDPDKPLPVPEPAFAPGDVVILPSGGCRMTVTRVDEEEVEVVWHDETGKLRNASFFPELAKSVLRRFDPEEFNQR